MLQKNNNQHNHRRKRRSGDVHSSSKSNSHNKQIHVVRRRSKRSRDKSNTKMLFVIILNLIITAAQIVGGIFAGSLSLISDALHNFSDCAALIISWVAIKISSKATNDKKTYGYKRSSILAALFNSSVLIAISVYLFREAYFRFLKPEPVNGFLVILVAILGLIANFIGATILHGDSKGNINIKSAYMHLLTDTLSSASVIVGGLIMYFYEVYWVDPLLTIAIGIYVLIESYKIIKQAIDILMQGVPQGVNINNIASDIESIQFVKRVHHIHVWSLDDKNIYFEAHINIDDMKISETEPLVDSINKILTENHRITHATLQLEHDRCNDVGVIHSS